jgi:hypothetical protein
MPQTTQSKMSDDKRVAIVIFNNTTKQFEKKFVDVEQLSTQYTCTLADFI